MENDDAEAPNNIGSTARHLRWCWFFKLFAPIPQLTTVLAASQNCDLPGSVGQDGGGRIRTPSNTFDIVDSNSSRSICHLSQVGGVAVSGAQSLSPDGGMDIRLAVHNCSPADQITQLLSSVKKVNVIALCLCYSSAACATSTPFQNYLNQPEFLHCRLLVPRLKFLDGDNQGGSRSGVSSDRGSLPD
jgi:hypothetical protein